MEILEKCQYKKDAVDDGESEYDLRFDLSHRGHGQIYSQMSKKCKIFCYSQKMHWAMGIPKIASDLTCDLGVMVKIISKGQI